MLLQKNPPAAGDFLTHSLHLLFSFHTIRRGEFKRIDLSALVKWPGAGAFGKFTDSGRSLSFTSRCTKAHSFGCKWNVRTEQLHCLHVVRGWLRGDH